MRYAYTVLSRRHFPRFYEEAVCGVPLLRAELPDEKRRTLDRCAVVMERYGVQRMLDDRLGERLPLVPTSELWQQHAAELALLLLEQSHIPPEKAVVGLLSRRVTKHVLAAAESLSDQVRAISLDVPDVNVLTFHLQQRNGVPVLRGAGDVKLCFSQGIEAEGAVMLGERQPQIPGFVLSADVETPEGCPAGPLLAVLIRAGKIGKEAVCVKRDEESFKK